MVMARAVDKNFWKGKRIFLTGHTGFKGSWLCLWLHSLGAVVKGYALEPHTNPSLFKSANIASLIEHEIGDIRDFDRLADSMKAFDPDIVIHMAAQPLVRLSYAKPVDTYATNVMGTVNVLESARFCSSIKALISVTTDKVYENREWCWGYREDEAMGGYDPYSSSKGCAELVTSAYRQSFFNGENKPAIASARAGNVIGGGDWSEDRLIPDALKAFEKGEKVIIRNPAAIRPWQHVLEPLSGYMFLAENLYQHGQKYATAWNFGPDDKDCKSVEWILNNLVEIRGNKSSWEIEKNKQPHEAQYLKLDCSKAKSQLNWYPKWDIETVLKKIVEWHEQFNIGTDIQRYCLDEIASYN
jgi:CDP-glucose 4,6-dehydratase